MSGYLFATACVVLLCACYRAGRAVLPRRWTAAVAAGAICVPAAQLATRPAGPAAVPGFVSVYLVFAVLPLLAGRYVAQQRRVADQGRLDERLRIARDMHDSLGRRLSLAAVQAAALEVADLPVPQHVAVARLGSAVRASVTELHEILGVLRGERALARGMAAVAGLVEEFRAAGAEVAVRSSGTPRPLPSRADEAAYRVVEEGLTNAIRHAPGRPVSITVGWEADGLQLAVVNAADCRGYAADCRGYAADCRGYAAGSGLAGLAGRLRQAGGVLRHELSGGVFRLHATLPAGPEPAGPGARARSGVRLLGLTVGILLLVILPATLLLGVY